MAIGKISPIKKVYTDSINTLEQQLSKNGFSRAPGTSETFFPYKESSGKYRTGLDVDAPYLQRLSEESRKVEIDRIIKDKDRMEKSLGIPGLLDPTSPFYNFASSPEVLKRKFGADLKVGPVKLGNREEIFDTTDVMREIEWNWIKVHPRIAPSKEAYEKGQASAETKYYLVDEETEQREVYTKKREINKAIVAFEELSPTKKKQIARLMGLPVTEDTREETVYNLLDGILKKTEFSSGQNKGYSPVRLFNDLLKTTDAMLKVKDLVEQALTFNIYRYGINNRITEGGVTVANSKEELIAKLVDDDGQLDLIALEKKLTHKKIEQS